MVNELVAHIQKINAETLAWVAEDPNNRWAGTLVEEPEHWARYDVHTVAQFEHYMAVSDYYESYKALYGIRPNWAEINAMSTEQLVEAMKKL